MKFGIVIPRPNPFSKMYNDCFLEQAETCLYGLRALGHETVMREVCNPEETSIIFGINTLPYGSKPPPNTLVYNLEQPSTGCLEMTRRHIVANPGLRVWEYKKVSLPYWAGHNIPAVHVPVGYVPELTVMKPSNDKDIDVFFSGCQNPRRIEILNALSRSRIRVLSVVDTFREKRNVLISRSKIVLNMHFYETKVFEICRVAQAVANHKAVLSEESSDAEDYEWLRGGIEEVPYEQLIQTCRKLLDNPARLKELEELGFEKFSKIDAREIFARALEEMPCE